MNKRDDFSQRAKITLAKRVGYICSSPTCGVHTIGANADPDKSTLVGVAAHITAALKGGPRYDEKLTNAERQHISNGIWLCAKCARMIDVDELKYPTPLLKEWKAKAEDKSDKRVNGQLKTFEPDIPFLEVDFVGDGGIRLNEGYTQNNPVTIEDGRAVMVINLAERIPHILYNIHRYYNLVIHNHSLTPAFNLQLENIGEVAFYEMGKIPFKNNIPSLGNITIPVKYQYRFAGTYIDADETQKPRFPHRLKDLKLKLTYYDAGRNVHYSFVTIQDDKVVTEKG